MELRVGAAGAEAGARLPAAHEEALYRLAQEALANVVKHARATRAVVTLVRDATVRLLVEDDGVGFGAPRGGFQLRAGRHAQARRDQRSHPPARQRRSCIVESREPHGRGGPLL